MMFSSQVAVITGASSGIGWALAHALAREGCKLGLIARRQDLLQQLAGEIRNAGATAEPAAADVSNREQLLNAVAELRGRLGTIDLMIANAGIGTPTRLEPMNTADIEKMFHVNLFGVIYSIEAVIGEMLQRRQGHLVAVSSMAAYKGLPAESAYCSSKAAVNCYMEGLRIQLRGSGVYATTICPGFVKTPMTDVNNFKMPFLMTADEAARRMVRAIKRRQKVYNFPWQMSLLMEATRYLPDWIMARMMRPYNEELPEVKL
jgi:short-subunit dehydrogenase